MQPERLALDLYGSCSSPTTGLRVAPGRVCQLDHETATTAQHPSLKAQRLPLVGCIFAVRSNWHLYPCFPCMILHSDSRLTSPYGENKPLNLREELHHSLFRGLKSLAAID